ncbi:DUF2867 domain-containing protein [Nitriliruptor alkaliphilus]|uniref:DUF2867 domain-containing protein n=1 Tax=Nitriliruptor alkaliphilus TaxID=427918 RepID=UPI00069746F6|nr:DUF2867 domain-containing protein [Nitriliruptor alkaliphilus]
MRNVHEREIAAPAERLAAAFDRLGGDDDQLWPTPVWQPLVLDRPLQVGADGGHGPVRYWVSEHEPGRRVRFTFHPGFGLDGHHELTVDPLGPDRCVVRHVLEARTTGAMRLLVPTVVRWLHDAEVEDLLDGMERVATGEVADPARWSPWVRLWWRLTEHPRPTAVAVPDAAALARDALAAPDLVDAWQVPLLRGMPSDPAVWATAIFGHRPRWVDALLWLRNGAVRVVGIDRGDERSFATIASDHREVLLGSDANHLDFRASILVDERAVTVSTVVRTHNRRGRAYMALVWPLHPVIVCAMLARARRELARRATRAEVHGTAA